MQIAVQLHGRLLFSSNIWKITRSKRTQKKKKAFIFCRFQFNANEVWLWLHSRSNNLLAEVMKGIKRRGKKEEISCRLNVMGMRGAAQKCHQQPTEGDHAALLDGHQRQRPHIASLTCWVSRHYSGTHRKTRVRIQTRTHPLPHLSSALPVIVTQFICLRT